MPYGRRKANRSVQQESDREGRIFTFKVIQLIWLLLGILEVLIALRIGLKLIGANPMNPIVAFIYGLTFLFLFPFAGMIQAPLPAAPCWNSPLSLPCWSMPWSHGQWREQFGCYFTARVGL